MILTWMKELVKKKKENGVLRNKGRKCKKFFKTDQREIRKSWGLSNGIYTDNIFALTIVGEDTVTEPSTGVIKDGSNNDIGGLVTGRELREGRRLNSRSESRLKNNGGTNSRKSRQVRNTILGERNKPSWPPRRARVRTHERHSRGWEMENGRKEIGVTRYLLGTSMDIRVQSNENGSNKVPESGGPVDLLRTNRKFWVTSIVKKRQ